MTMYHITDKAVIDALVKRASDHNLDMRVIVDGKSLTGGYKLAFQTMTAAGVQVRGSSHAFTLTHSKDIVIDRNTAIISAINMTNTAQNTRDFGIITRDPAVISEVESVFETDWQNAQDNGRNTPALSNQNLAWSPNNSTAQLVKLIDSAHSTLDVEVENLGSQYITDALNRAAQHQVNVRLIVPECALGNAYGNYKYIAQLHGVNVHVEHDGGSMQQPYMHSKMMVADNQYVYVGSINYSFSSTQNDRELGAIFLDESTAQQLVQEFETDWGRSQAPAQHPECPKQNF
jgi:cardiolipin synthase A/B